MDKRAKVMIMATLCILILVIIKSLWIDPVGGLEGDHLKYKRYALEMAPQQDTPFNINSSIVTYKVLSVKQISDEGKTIISYRDKGKNFEEELEGEYIAKVRAYFFHVLPFTDLNIKGGQE